MSINKALNRKLKKLDISKKEFIELLMTKGEFSSKAEAERKLGNVLEAIEDVLVKGDEISFLGFGKFEVTEVLELVEILKLF